MSDYYVGEIRIFAGNYAPLSWAICDGSVLQISEYQVLYAVIGNTYGGTSTTFSLPDLRGRLPVHRKVGAPAGTQFSLGNQGGTETVTLTYTQMPSHTHNFLAASAGATTPTPASNLVLGAAVPPWLQYSPNSGDIQTAPFSAAAVTSVGGNNAHANIMPGLVVNYIIALQGLFPSQN